MGLGLKLAEIFTSISSENWPTRFSKFDLEIFFHIKISKNFFFHFYHSYVNAILLPYGNSEIWKTHYQIICL